MKALSMAWALCAGLMEPVAVHAQVVSGLAQEDTP